MTLADLDLNKVYTYADYFKWQFEERVELIKGKIFKMSPAPVSIHQRLCQRINSELYNFLKGKKCEVFFAPFDVRLPRKSIDDKEIFTVVQPDICVICDPAKIDRRGCIGAPDIVVEILSPGNNSKEMKNKYEAYEEAGVKEYWIVSPENETFMSYTLEEGRYVANRILVAGDIVTSTVLPGFSMDLEVLFASV